MNTANVADAAILKGRVRERGREYANGVGLVRRKIRKKWLNSVVLWKS
jgi:hypothetical protein